ncbi:AT-rich interactive domain-containing protein 5-like [Solanum lycopersicum]|uniref:AT-rich interactive domain-containing protein 5-like n=1 Tax=Solanum lycopersicum TaxID=4081 RepID=UPI00374A20E4
MVVDRSDDPQIKTNATIITADDDARSDQFLKVTIEVNDSFAFIGEDNEVSHEDQTAFIEKLGTFYREKAVEFKLPRFYGHPLNCLKLWKFVIKLGGYDQDLHYCSWTFHGFYEKLLLQYERHTTKIGVLQLPISPSPIDNEGSGYPISASGRAVRDSAARCRLGWQQKHLLGYGEVAESIDMIANNMPKRAKRRKTSGKIDHHSRSLVFALTHSLIKKNSDRSRTSCHIQALKHEGKNEEEHLMKAAEAKTSHSWSYHLLELISFGPALMSPFMGVFMFMCPLRSRISESTMQKY